MFDTATTAFYHTNNQPARGLFSNFTLPSSLPSQLLQNSLTMFPLGLFGQQEQGATTTANIQADGRTVTSAASTAGAIAAPAPPLSPPLSPPAQTTAPTPNRRSSRRNKSVGSTQATGNMNAQQNNTTVTHQHNSGHNHHGGQRRKKLSNKINRKLIDQAITFSAIAVEEDQQGNHQCALDLYVTALESMLYAMPIHTDTNRKEAVKEKLREFIDHVGLSDEFIQPQPVSDTKPQSCHHAPISSNADGNSPTSKQVIVPTTPISEHIIKGAITTAVALKQSPIPDAISATVNYTMKKVKQIDETYGLQEKAWEISRTGINLALEIDQQYNVHEKVGNALFTGLAAAMKAGIAYKDSPSYQELKRMKAEYSKH